jgi:hypothetical protein
MSARSGRPTAREFLAMRPMTWALSISTSFGSLPTSPPTSALREFLAGTDGPRGDQVLSHHGNFHLHEQLARSAAAGHHHLGRSPAARTIHRHVEAVAASGKALGVYFPDDRHRISRQVPDLHAQKFLYRLPDGG